MSQNVGLPLNTIGSTIVFLTTFLADIVTNLHLHGGVVLTTRNKHCAGTTTPTESHDEEEAWCRETGR